MTHNMAAVPSPHNIILRAPEPDDIDRIFLWENDRNAWESAPATAPVSRMQVWEYVHSYDADPARRGELRLMAVADNGETVGHADLFEINMSNRRAGVAVYIDPARRRQGYGLAVLRAVCEYARLRLDMHQLWAHIAVDNTASKKLFADADFKPAGRLRSWLRRDGHWVDVLVWQQLFA